MKPNTILHYSELNHDQKQQVATLYPTTSQPRSTHRPLAFDDYVYEVDNDGKVIDRKTTAQHERDTAPLVKRKPVGVKIDGWDI